MFLRKYRILIVITFLSIFSAKMVISGAPVFFSHIDKNIMISVIMQIEAEHSSDGDPGKAKVKLFDYKIDFQHDYVWSSVLHLYGIKNSFIDNFKRYFDPFHPSVPTPPPNLS
ncbi:MULTISPECIES: hypothetical protein [Pedobacter]|uniref:Uncharacterized protein n=1 Tax=Pedobacter panaciterrae TaxID=363849 RepID=A0ABU8NR31_9SPHI|nr:MULTISPECIES: hypothetical protein [Pedobacter]ETZ19988.1 hypothetical protein N824_07190 [Pedobacter sp. V48]NQX54670.1 hypothetical protein [Pedobacter panaciterrae]